MYINFTLTLTFLLCRVLAFYRVGLIYMLNASPKAIDFDVYQPRNPKASAYYRCVEDHFEQLEAVWLPAVEPIARRGRALSATLWLLAALCDRCHPALFGLRLVEYTEPTPRRDCGDLHCSNRRSELW